MHSDTTGTFPFDLNDIPTSIVEFFTPEEFAEISDYEKKHLQNLRHNYETFSRAGKSNVTILSIHNFLSVVFIEVTCSVS
jgi:hypothetical protein